MHPITIQIPEWPAAGQTTMFIVTRCGQGDDIRKTEWSRDVVGQGSVLSIPINLSSTTVTTVEMAQEMARADPSFAVETLRALGWGEHDLHELIIANLNDDVKASHE